MTASSNCAAWELILVILLGRLRKPRTAMLTTCSPTRIASSTRSQLVRFRGREVNTSGDSFLAMFDGPQRAIRCAMAIRDAVQALGIEVRAGLHTGECEVRGDDIGGIAVHIGARVCGLAGPNDVLVSSTLRDLVIGSELEFEDRGAHELKGVPGEWRLFAVAAT
jgi:class 3 adenylate cyclase